MPQYLVSRLADPILGLSTGVLAYYLWENDGRNAEQRPEGRTLAEIVARKWEGVRPVGAPGGPVRSAGGSASASAGAS